MRGKVAKRIRLLGRIAHPDADREVSYRHVNHGRKIRFVRDGNKTIPLEYHAVTRVVAPTSLRRATQSMKRAYKDPVRAYSVL
jgi:hypothetical protein